MTRSTTTLETILERTRELYSLPQVAAEVVQLTAEPNVDVAALKRCIEHDAALTTKILRVVNSSLFGLGSEVRDLSQALALLGTKPLKLLALGFCLPDRLFLDVAAEDLRRYWTASLTRAVAARELAEAVGSVPGDEAFIAGLLHDVGQLVLIKELGEPFVRVLHRVREDHADLIALEREALGFDHRQLSVILLSHWGLPNGLVMALEQTQRFGPSDSDPSRASLAAVLYVSDLLAELVVDNRLRILPDLLQYAARFCQQDTEAVKDLVARIQLRVESLADILSVPLASELDYLAVVAEAHRQLGHAAAEAAVPLARLASIEDPQCAAIWDELHELTTATENYLSPGRPEPRSVPPRDSGLASTLAANLHLAAAECRSRRVPLTLLLIEVGDGVSRDERQLGPSAIAPIIAAACRELADATLQCCPAAIPRWALILPDFERHEAVHLGQSITTRVVKQIVERGAWLEPSSIRVGVATVDVIPHNFDIERLLDAAARCVGAAGLAGGANVKSIAL